MTGVRPSQPLPICAVERSQAQWPTITIVRRASEKAKSPAFGWAKCLIVMVAKGGIEPPTRQDTI